MHINRWINSDITTQVEYYSAKEGMASLIHDTTYINLKIIMLSKRMHTQKNVLGMIPRIYISYNTEKYNK